MRPPRLPGLRGQPLSERRKQQIVSMVLDEDWPVESVITELGVPERHVRAVLNGVRRHPAPRRRRTKAA